MRVALFHSPCPAGLGTRVVVQAGQVLLRISKLSYPFSSLPSRVLLFPPPSKLQLETDRPNDIYFRTLTGASDTLSHEL